MPGGLTRYRSQPAETVIERLDDRPRRARFRVEAPSFGSKITMLDRFGRNFDRTVAAKILDQRACDLRERFIDVGTQP
jgi:hypothetical protein